MHIKRYTISALIFMVLLGIFVYQFVSQDIVGIRVFDTQLPALPVALWVVAPVLVFFIASVLHMSYYSLIKHFKLRRYQKDYDTLSQAISDAFLGKENRIHHYHTTAYQKLGKLVDRTRIEPMEGLDATGNETVDGTLSLLREVANGNIVELKKLHLDKENAIACQNQMNQLERGKLTPEDVLSKAERYSRSVCEEAFAKLVETAPLYAIEKYREFMNQKALLVIARRINADENILEIANDAMIALIELVDLECEDYIALSAAMGTSALPDQRIKIFETLSTQNEKATEAYVYTLFDLEMLAPAEEILDNSQADELQHFKAYRALKECGKNFNIDLFVPSFFKA